MKQKSNPIIKIYFNENFIDRVSNYIYNKHNDLSKIAVVFPGKRPRFYLYKSLAKIINKPFLPPNVFSIDEFMKYIVEKDRGTPISTISDIDVIWLIYKFHPDKPSMETFLPWGANFFSCIEELDTELVEDEKLSSSFYEKKEIPDVAYKFVSNIKDIRRKVHSYLIDNNLWTRGFIYKVAATNIEKYLLEEFDTIYFCGFFFLTKAEKKVIYSLAKRGRAEIIINTDGNSWTPFSELNKEFNIVETEQPIDYTSNIKIYSAFDTHSEVMQSKDILSNIYSNNHKDNICIVLPKAEALIPFLSLVMEDKNLPYNISMGYPIKRTPIYTLFENIIECQQTKKEGYYYTKNYLNLLLHPYVKNLYGEESRILIQKIEEELINEGKFFIMLDEIETNSRLIQTQKEKEIISFIHNNFFINIERINKIKDMGENFIHILKILSTKSPAKYYPFAYEFISKFYQILEKLSNCIISNESLPQSTIFNIFRLYVFNQIIPFEGTPVSGLQILGMLETRCLNFDKVIIFDVNEGIIPEIKKYDPLLPATLRNYLGLPDYKKEDEIFKYYFTHLIKGAKESHIIYQQTEEKIRSRFIEEIIWQEEQKQNKLGVMEPIIKTFKTEVKKEPGVKIEKSKEIINRIKNEEISPSYLDVYLHCPLKFYYQCVLKLTEKEEIEEDIKAEKIGSLIHKVLKELYEVSVIKDTYPFDEITLIDILNKKYKEEFKVEKIVGEHLLTFEVIKYKLLEFIKKEKEEKFITLAVEKEYKCNFENFVIKGIIDRIDKRENKIFLIDYKTGAYIMKPTMKNIWNVNVKERKDIKEKIKSLQLPMYLFIYKNNNKKIDWQNINAMFYSLRENKEIYFFNKKEADKKSLMENIFIPVIKNLLYELLNPNIPFEKDDEDKIYCKYCPFSVMCKK